MAATPRPERAMKLIESILADAASIAAVRRDLHAHPELCFQEQRTSDVIAKQLTDWGPFYVLIGLSRKNRLKAAPYYS